MSLDTWTIINVLLVHLPISTYWRVRMSLDTWTTINVLLVSIPAYFLDLIFILLLFFYTFHYKIVNVAVTSVVVVDYHC